jgi:uncharacterized membrane protein (TIGR02234 family)
VNARRLKLVLLVAGLGLSGLVFLAWTQTWFLIALDEGPTLNVAGDVAAPALSTLALTCLVLNGALSIAGPVFRVILGALEALLGVTVVFSGVLALADPVKASAASVSEATGVAGAEALGALVASVSTAAWPWVATAAGALLVLLGVLVAATARRWPGSGRKYSAVRLASAERDAVDDWDSLSDGNDPT